MSNPRAILIAGPTASGKSALALALAERLGGVVINADAMQVYRDLRLITARPSPQDEARAPHRLYGHVDAADNYSVGRWCRDAAAVLDAAARDRCCPILVGGTGLYFKALTQGLSAVPPTPPEVRAAVRARGDAEGVAALHAELNRRDPAVASRLRPGDRMRIATRAARHTVLFRPPLLQLVRIQRDLDGLVSERSERVGPDVEPAEGIVVQRRELLRI